MGSPRSSLLATLLWLLLLLELPCGEFRKSKTYYEVLGVSEDAAASDIRQSYHKLSLLHHPDKGGDSAEFIRISEAYATLGDKKKRRVYDRTHQQGSLDLGDAVKLFASSFGIDVLSARGEVDWQKVEGKMRQMQSPLQDMDDIVGELMFCEDAPVPTTQDKHSQSQWQDSMPFCRLR